VCDDEYIRGSLRALSCLLIYLLLFSSSPLLPLIVVLSPDDIPHVAVVLDEDDDTIWPVVDAMLHELRKSVKPPRREVIHGETLYGSRG
jgi:hypothetical protein